MDRFRRNRQPEDERRGLRLAARNLTVVSGVFSLVVALIMLFNLLRTAGVDPLEMPQMERLIALAKKQPQNTELKKQIRALDLLARRAYFSNNALMRSGTWMLLAGLAVLLLSLKLRAVADQRRPAPEKQEGDDRDADRLLERWSLGGFAAALFLFALFLPLLFPEIGDDEFFSGLRAKKRSGETAPAPTPTELKNNWTAFRGPYGLGIASASNVPARVDDPKTLLWKTAVPLSGFSSPVIWKERLFLSGGDKKERRLFCYSVTNGKLLWQKTIPFLATGSKIPAVTRDTGFAAPTPVTDGRQIYVMFATGDIAAFSLDGDIRWKRNLGVPDINYGHASSLYTLGGKIFVQFDDRRAGRILALHWKDGKTLWRRARKVRASWASPILAKIGDSVQLVLSAPPLVAGYNPEDGKELWAVNAMDGEVGPSPAFGAGMVFAVQEYSRLAAIVPGTTQAAWTKEEDLSEVSSPVATENCLIVATHSGVISAYQPKTGKRLWKQEFREGFWSSPIAVGNRIHLFNRKGQLHVFEAFPEYRPIAVSKLGEDVVSSPAVLDNRLFIRGTKHLYCFGVKP